VYLSERVDADEIAEVVGKWTGIPVSRLLEGEVEKLIHMEERLHQRRDRPGGGRPGRRPTHCAAPAPA
jgi:hypothetical protein